MRRKMFDWRSITKKFAMLVLAIFITALSFWILDRENFNHILNASWRILDEDSYFKHYTVPLRRDVARDLCTQFKIPDSDFRCKDQKVYALDFYPAIVEYYSTIASEDRTLPAVQERIGKYQVEVEKKSKNGTYNYWYWFDFTGNQKYPLIIVFDENGVMIDIRTRAGRDS